MGTIKKHKYTFLHMDPSPNKDSVSVYTETESYRAGGPVAAQKTAFVTLFKSYLCGEAKTRS